MRVERALEKLRGRLTRRGVTSSSAGLALALVHQAVSAAPLGLVASINDKEDEVTLKVDESSNVRLRVLKSSIVRIVNPEENKDQKEAGGQS